MYYRVFYSSVEFNCCESGGNAFGKLSWVCSRIFFRILDPGPNVPELPGGGELPYEEYMGVCHELGSYF